MEQKIKNREALLSHGDAAGRRIVLDVAEAALERLDARERIRSIARMEGDVLCIGERRWDLSKKRHVYLLGAGKACNHMAMAVEEVLGDHLTAGIAIVKSSEPTDIFLTAFSKSGTILPSPNQPRSPPLDFDGHVEY